MNMNLIFLFNCPLIILSQSFDIWNPMRLIIIFLIFLVFIESRRYTNQYSLPSLRRNKGWIFLDRMRFQQGKASIDFKAQLFLKEASEQKLFNIQLAIIPDNLWNTQVLLQCRPIQDQTIKSLTYYTITAQMDKQNDYIFQKSIIIEILAQQTYHFVLKDCRKSLVTQYFSRESKLEISIHMLNNGKEYGQQEQSNHIFLPLLVVLSVALIKINNVNLRSSLDNQIDWGKLLLVITLWINLIALVCKLFNYLLYAYVTGKQYAFFDFTYLLFHSISQSVITCLLIFISYGWTITFMSGKDFDLYIPLLTMLGLINIILTLLNKINDNDHDKYHMYDSIPAYILVFFRVVATIIFIIGSLITFVYNPKNKSLRTFYKKFFILGFSYFLSLPALMLLSRILPAVYRQQFVFICVQGIKNVLNVLLTYMISSKKSNYKQIKYASQSFMMDKDNKYL